MRLPREKLEQTRAALTACGLNKMGSPRRRRAKLFRWESDSWEKEVKLWKERGTGDVRFLQHKETKKVRSYRTMRRLRTRFRSWLGQVLRAHAVQVPMLHAILVLRHRCGC